MRITIGISDRAADDLTAIGQSTGFDLLEIIQRAPYIVCAMLESVRETGGYAAIRTPHPNGMLVQPIDLPSLEDFDQGTDVFVFEGPLASLGGSMPPVVVVEVALPDDFVRKVCLTLGIESPTRAFSYVLYTYIVLLKTTARYPNGAFGVCVEATGKFLIPQV